MEISVSQFCKKTSEYFISAFDLTQRWKNNTFVSADHLHKKLRNSADHTPLKVLRYKSF